MPDTSLYDLLHKMDAENIVLAYKGEINTKLLEAVYSMMHSEENKSSLEKNKKFFHILVESLQNIIHHQVPLTSVKKDSAYSPTGFIITHDGKNSYKIITGM